VDPIRVAIKIPFKLRSSFIAVVKTIKRKKPSRKLRLILMSYFDSNVQAILIDEHKSKNINSQHIPAGIAKRFLHFTRFLWIINIINNRITISRIDILITPIL